MQDAQVTKSLRLQFLVVLSPDSKLYSKIFKCHQSFGMSSAGNDSFKMRANKGEIYLSYTVYFQISTLDKQRICVIMLLKKKKKKKKKFVYCQINQLAQLETDVRM